jgi:HEAT repeat protein
MSIRSFMKIQNIRARSLAATAGAMIAMLSFALMMTIPAYSQGQGEKAWEILKAGAASKSADSRVRAMQAMGLISKNPAAEKMALAALGDEKSEVRAAAAICLGEVGSPNAIPALKQAARDSAAEVLFAAAAALYKLNDPAAYQIYYAALTRQKKSGESLVDSQMKMLKDPKALAKMGFEQGINFIPFAGLGYGAVKAIGKDDESPIRAAAALRLARDPDPKSAEALASAAGDGKWLVRAAAIDAIGRRGDAALLKAVAPRLTDDNETVRFNAAACIIRLSK